VDRATQRNNNNMDESAGILALKIFLIFFLVFLNGFFVAAEFAIVKVRLSKIQMLAQKGARRARMAQHVIEHLDAYLSATQLGITIASILLGWVGEETMRETIVGPILHRLSITNETLVRVISFLFGTGIIVFLHVVLGELAPKSLAIQKAEATSLWLAYPLHWFYLVLYPFIAALNGTANGVLRIFGIRPAGDHEMAHSEDELRILMGESQRTGILTSDKLDLLDNILDFSTVTVRQIMVPRTEVAAFNLRVPLAENLQVAERTAHSRYPLVDGDLDHVVGVIHMKDLFWQMKDMEMSPQDAAEAAERRNPMIAGGDIAAHTATGAQFLTAIAREVLFVPETMRIDRLLKDFQQKRVHMAMVVDEYGGSSGMVTFENVIEEIVGEVQDEFDQEAPLIRQLKENEFLVDGITTLVEFNEVAGTELESEDADTIGGFVIAGIGRIPKPGDTFQTERLQFIVREMRRQRIHRMLVRVNRPITPQETEPPSEPEEKSEQE
jgi:CBS domain containing-hemolysin-like protein